MSITVDVLPVFIYTIGGILSMYMGTFSEVLLLVDKEIVGFSNAEGVDYDEVQIHRSLDGRVRVRVEGVGEVYCGDALILYTRSCLIDFEERGGQ